MISQPTKRLKALDASKKDKKKDEGTQHKAKGKAPMTHPDDEDAEEDNVSMTHPDDEDAEEAKKPRGRLAKDLPPTSASPAVAEKTATLETVSSLNASCMCPSCARPDCSLNVP
jgi:hypothetical protein